MLLKKCLHKNSITVKGVSGKVTATVVVVLGTIQKLIRRL